MTEVRRLALCRGTAATPMLQSNTNTKRHTSCTRIIVTRCPPTLCTKQGMGGDTKPACQQSQTSSCIRERHTAGHLPTYLCHLLPASNLLAIRSSVHAVARRNLRFSDLTRKETRGKLACVLASCRRNRPPPGEPTAPGKRPRVLHAV